MRDPTAIELAVTLLATAGVSGAIGALCRDGPPRDPKSALQAGAVTVTAAALAGASLLVGRPALFEGDSWWLWLAFGCGGAVTSAVSWWRRRRIA